MSVGRYDRAFYTTIAVGLAITVVVGFGPTYYFRTLTPSPMATLSGGPVTLLVGSREELERGEPRWTEEHDLTPPK